MTLKYRIKLKTTDKYLSPLREQMCGLIRPNSEVVEIGSGTGDLLFRLAPKIQYGLGMEASKSFVKCARILAIEKGYSNIFFTNETISSDYKFSKNYDYSIMSLFLHVLPRKEAFALLKKCSEISDKTIIAAFSKPPTNLGAFLLWLDQRFTSHYKNFKTYAQNGYFKSLIKDSGLKLESEMPTFDPAITIYTI